MKRINKQLSYAPADLRVSYCGWASPAMQQMGDLFKKQLCLLCYEEAKSVEELSQALQTGTAYIQDAVEALTRLKIMKKMDGKYLTSFPMLPLNKNYQAGALNYKLVQEKEIPAKINDLLLSLKPAISRLDFYGNDFDLSYLNWFLYTVLNNCILSQLRSYYSDKTDQIVLNKNAWQSKDYDFSLCASFIYADEKIEDDKLEKRLDKISTYYNRLGAIQVNNVFDATPFPTAFDEEKSSFNKREGRNLYLTLENIDFYLNLVKGINRDFTEEEEKCLKDFEKNGVVEKTREGYKPMIPVFSEDTYYEVEKLINKAVIPIVKEIAEAAEDKIEKLLLPELGGVKERIDQFYTFWLCYFLSPIQELYWYGMNVEGLLIPQDYSRSVAGIYIVV